MRGMVAGFAAVVLIAGCGTQPAPAPSRPSSAATDHASSADTPSPPAASPSEREQTDPTSAAGGYIGTLTRYCDLGACCPAVDVHGTLYALHLPAFYAWRGTRDGYEVRARDGRVVVSENAMVWVRGDETGGDTCYATTLYQGLDATRMARAYIGGLVRSGVCLVLSTEEQLLELRFADGWDDDLVGGRMVVRDDKGRVVMGEGDRIAVTAVRETEHTGSFCMVGDDIVRITRILEVSG